MRCTCEPDWLSLLKNPFDINKNKMDKPTIVFSSKCRSQHRNAYIAQASPGQRAGESSWSGEAGKFFSLCLEQKPTGVANLDIMIDCNECGSGDSSHVGTDDDARYIRPIERFNGTALDRVLPKAGLGNAFCIGTCTWFSNRR